jgi:hypothetical protein
MAVSSYGRALKTKLRSLFLFTARALAVIRYAKSMAPNIGRGCRIAGAASDQGRRHRTRQ